MLVVFAETPGANYGLAQFFHQDQDGDDHDYDGDDHDHDGDDQDQDGDDHDYDHDGDDLTMVTICVW